MPGAEVSTADGHVLALGIEENVLPGRSVDDTIRTIHYKGGLAIVPHMDLSHTPSVSSEAVENLLDSNDTRVHPDGIEVFNAAGEALHRMPLVGTLLFRPDTNQMAMRFHEEQFPSGTAFAGIDAHGTTFGTLTGYEGDSAFDALNTGKTIVVYNPDQFGLKGQIKETFIMGSLAVRNKVGETRRKRTSRNEGLS